MKDKSLILIIIFIVILISITVTLLARQEVNDKISFSKVNNNLDFC